MGLFLGFLVGSFFLAPLAKLLKFQFALNTFLIFTRPIIGAFAFATAKRCEMFLRHISNIVSEPQL